MDRHSTMYAPIQLELVMEGVIWKIMMQLVTMMVVIAALMLFGLVMASATKKTKTKSVTLIGWIAAKTGNQLEMGFAMLKTIMNIVTLIEAIAVLVVMVEMVFVMMSTIIHGVVPMMWVIAVWMSQSQTTALIANAVEIACPSAM